LVCSAGSESVRLSRENFFKNFNFTFLRVRKENFFVQYYEGIEEKVAQNETLTSQAFDTQEIAVPGTCWQRRLNSFQLFFHLPFPFE
jgi:hypothetical protein